jgi:hypothetical protein
VPAVLCQRVEKENEMHNQRGNTRSVRGAAVTVAAAMMLSGCGGGGAPTGPEAQTENSPPSVEISPTAVAPQPLVGEWQRLTTCTEGVRALKQAGFAEFALEFAAGNGFVPGVSSPDQLADPSHPCKGAVPRKHSHFFTEGGEFGSRDWNGEQVDDGAYEILDDRTFVIGDTTFHYKIQGDSIKFEPVIPSDCSTDDCRDSAAWSVAVAFPGKSWERVT